MKYGYFFQALLKRKTGGLGLPDGLTLLDGLEKLDKIRSSCVLLLLERNFRGREGQRDIPSFRVLPRSSHRAMLGNSRFRSRRSSFEKAKDEVFECLKLGVSGSWESFCHGRFRVVFAGTDRLC